MPGALFAPFRKRQRRTVGSTVLATPAAPDTPSTPSPADAATAYYTLLSWVSARATNFDVYLSTTNPPTAIVAPQIQSTSYVPTLLPATTYYWKIVAFNAGGSATGPVWSFTTPAATQKLFELAGSVINAEARIGSVLIRDVLGATANTASLTVNTTAPNAGDAIKIGLGTLDDDALEFAGEVQRIAPTYQGRPANTNWLATLIDHTFRINRRRPFGTWVSTSASLIGRYLVATFGHGFTSDHIQDGLPAISINFDGTADFMTCFRALATAISDDTHVGKTKVDYARDVYLFLTPDADQDAPSLDATNPPQTVPLEIAFSEDLSQIRTRNYGKGHAERIPTNVLINDTILPIPNAVMFETTGGTAIVATTSDGAQTTIITYAGIQLGGGVSMVGPGVAPSVAPSAAQSYGTGLGNGVYQYAYTDVTASGESLPSPTVSITVGPTTSVTAPTGGPTVDPNGTGTANYNAGTALLYVYSYRTASGETVPGTTTATTSITNGAGASKTINLTAPCSSDASVTLVIFYESHDGGVTFRQFDSVTNVPSTTASTTNTGPGFASLNPVSNNVSISGVAVGATGTTSRKIYRTVVGGSQLKLQQTIANNTATTGVVDATADGSLGANVPTSDTSGLTQTSGQVNAGSTSVLTAGAAAFSATGGWASVGQSYFRYTGLSANTLTGIPASGVGALAATILYGAQIVAVPALTGINSNNGIPLAMASGSSVNIWVQRDDLAAQAALGAVELDADGNPTDGIREFTITDERRGKDSLAALCDADLAIFSRPIVSVQFYTRSIMRAGQTVHIDLAGFSTYAGDYTIQSVEITFDVPTEYPLRFVRASSVSFTLRDLIQRVTLS